jgi:hypothetical protein
MMALKGRKPRKAPVPSRCRGVQNLAVDRSLEEDSGWKRKPKFGGCVRASWVVENI